MVRRGWRPRLEGGIDELDLDVERCDHPRHMGQNVLGIVRKCRRALIRAVGRCGRAFSLRPPSIMVGANGGADLPAGRVSRFQHALGEGLAEPQVRGHDAMVQRPAAWRTSPSRAALRDRQSFEQNFTSGVWALHVYAWKHNPEGLFAAWNPTISCQCNRG